MLSNKRFPLAATCLLGILAVVGCEPGAQNGGMKFGQMNVGRPPGLDQYVQAVRAYDSGDTDRATNLLQQATRTNPNLTMAHAMLGDMYRAKGDYEAALREYKEAARLDPYTAESHYKLGVAYQLLQRSPEAADAYKRAIELDPNHALANMNLGLVYVALGQLDDAVKYTTKATQIDPNSAIAFSNLGVALDAQGKYAEAETAYRRSLEIDPKQEVTQLNLATNLLTQNKNDAALKILRDVVAAADTPANHKRLGDALARAGQPDQALLEYEKAIQGDPNYYPALNAIGSMRIAEYKKGLELDDDKRQAAIKMWAQSLSINPEQPKIRAALNEWRKYK
jgi:tetratricopeptide (TPR) repeat protein